jgi:UDP-2,4-diacetamido-2,4,6-trideoxy-beta-L-altropyranose hydrolase
MKVAIRADASPAIGSGHVMRCLALADALAARGDEVRFVTRELPPHLAKLIRERGHEPVSLPVGPMKGDQAPQQAWPLQLQLEDAAATRAALAADSPDWLVVDHYGLAAEWESDLRGLAAHLLAIDDLGRAHACDLLLDANHDPQARSRYAGSAPGAWLLLGPAYLLLRPDFAQRRKSLAPRSGPVRRLMVFLGGMDAGNATGRVLQAVRLLREPPPLDVVVGASHPALREIQAFCDAHPGSRCHVQTSDMAGLLAQCDAAVGAGGGANWERCCLGVPTLALALAENQAAVLAAAAEAGLVVLPDGGLPEPELLAVHLEAFLRNGALRRRLSAAGMALVDGRGTTRVVAAMRGLRLRMRAAQAQDCDALHAWRNAAEVRAVSRNDRPIALEEHRRWFASVLADPRRALLVGEDAEGPVGVVRFDVDERGDQAEVSIYLAPGRHGQGLGPALLRAGERWLAANRPEVAQVRAEVLAGNHASTQLFEQSGYEPASHGYRKRIESA